MLGRIGGLDLALKYVTKSSPPSLGSSFEESTEYYKPNNRLLSRIGSLRH